MAGCDSSVFGDGLEVALGCLLAGADELTSFCEALAFGAKQQPVSTAASHEEDWWSLAATLDVRDGGGVARLSSTGNIMDLACSWPGGMEGKSENQLPRHTKK